jgi:hypothetical protein
MSDKKQSNTEKKDNQERKPWLRKPGRGQGRGQFIKKKDPEEVPILTFGPNNNFTQFKLCQARRYENMVTLDN